MLNGRKALDLMLAVVETVITVAAITEQPRAETDAILPHTFALLTISELRGIARFFLLGRLERCPW